MFIQIGLLFSQCIGNRIEILDYVKALDNYFSVLNYFSSQDFEF